MKCADRCRSTCLYQLKDGNHRRDTDGAGQERVMPVRIQRKRTKGWRMPESAVYVGRPTVFGNNFDVATYGRRLAVFNFRQRMQNMLLINPRSEEHTSELQSPA